MGESRVGDRHTEDDRLGQRARDGEEEREEERLIDGTDATLNAGFVENGRRRREATCIFTDFT